MNYVLIAIDLALISATAYSVITKKWYRSLPLLSTYVFVLTISTLIILVTCAGQKIPGKHQYDFCRAYYITYFTDLMLSSVFSIIVLYEFLFRMASGKRTIQLTAIAGCMVTAGLSLAAAIHLGHTPEHFVTVFWYATTLTLLLAGLFIWVMKAVFSLALQKRLAILLTIIAVYPFAQAMGDKLRGNAGQFFAQSMWPIFALTLYAILRKAPAAPQQLPSPTINI